MSVPKVRINHQIKAPEVRVIDDQGKMVGIMKLSDALSLALDQGVDLVEVSPQAKPPVVKLLNYDKFRYQQEKAAQEARKKVKRVTLKEVKLSIRISQHDLDFKAKKADEFLSEGNKVKVDVQMRGREQAHPQLAYELMKKFQALLTVGNILEAGPARMGGTVSIILAPK
ncbi:MAG: translation initiation factor IF-3 [Candidatus Doudnabacteria bacterium]|nr:translation initiation factor IF-3 [Candidatus Doudnabacteria bacterium]